jgi:hypothetical protein
MLLLLLLNQKVHVQQHAAVHVHVMHTLRPDFPFWDPYSEVLENDIEKVRFAVRRA